MMVEVSFIREPENELFHDLDKSELFPVHNSLFSNMIWYGDFSIEDGGNVFLMENVPLMAIANQLLFGLPEVALYKKKITIQDPESTRVFEVEEVTQDEGETKVVRIFGNFSHEAFLVDLEKLYVALHLASLSMYREVVFRHPELRDSLMLKMYLLAFASAT
jgi:hypothetical protein